MFPKETKACHRVLVIFPVIDFPYYHRFNNIVNHPSNPLSSEKG
jgi:hypothetical protein